MCVLWLGMGLSLFLLRSLIAKQVWYLWPVFFCDYRIVLNIQKIKQKSKTDICCLAMVVICHLCDNLKWCIFTREEKKQHCHN